MNGYERILAALQLREPDQVPIMEWAIDPKVVEGLCPGCNYFDLVEEMNLDGVAVGGHQFVRRHARGQVGCPLGADSRGILPCGGGHQVGGRPRGIHTAQPI